MIQNNYLDRGIHGNDVPSPQNNLQKIVACSHDDLLSNLNHNESREQMKFSDHGPKNWFKIEDFEMTEQDDRLGLLQKYYTVLSERLTALKARGQSYDAQ